MGDAQLLSADDISGRLQTPPSGLLPPPDAGGGPLSPPASPMEFFAPTGAAVDDYVHYLNNDAAFQFGFKQIDLCFPSGLDKGDMALILGKSHQGKSTVTYSAIINNLERSEDFTCVFYSPDEPRELAVQKMACMALGLNAAKMEEDLKAGDTGALRKIQNVANGLLDRVLINDQSLTFASMLRGIYEAEDYWQRPVSACVLDYLELLAGDSDANGVAGKAQAAKRFAKDADVPLIVLHQAGRGSGDPGKPAGMHGGRFGGESESVLVLETYLPKARTDLSERDRAEVENVIRLNLCKNKRPPYSLRDVEMILDPECGRVREITIDDLENRQWANL